MNHLAPPRIAQFLLEQLLDATQRETIAGDLIEQYCEDILPNRNAVAARLWYWRQTISFLSLRGIRRMAGEFRARNPILTLAALVAVVEYAIIIGIPSTVLRNMLALLVVGLAVSGLFSAGFQVDWRSLRRGCRAGAALFTILAVATINVSLIAAPIFVACVLVLFAMAGFVGAWRASNAGEGMLLAMMVGIAGSVIALPLLLIGIRLGFEQSHPPLYDFIPIATGVSVVLGALGAYGGKGVKALVQGRHREATLTALTLVFLVGCSGAGAIADLVQAHEVRPNDAVELAALPFGAERVTVRGTVSTLLSIPSGIRMIVVHGIDGKTYAMNMTGRSSLSKKGVGGFNLRPGEQVTVSAVLAKGGKMIKGFTAARADEMTDSQGKVLFARQAPGS